MRVRSSKSSKRYIIGIIVLLLLFMYFVFFLFFGARGVIAKQQLEQQYTELQLDLEKTRRQREELEFRASRLRPNSLDKDLLEERAREVMGYAYEGEVILPAHQLDRQGE